MNNFWISELDDGIFRMNIPSEKHKKVALDKVLIVVHTQIKYTHGKPSKLWPVQGLITLESNVFQTV